MSASRMPDDLLVGHRQDHVPAVAVLEPAELRPDRVVAAAGPPDVGRVDDRHLHLLAADPVLLLADDLLDPVVDPLAERQQRVDPGAELADVAGPQQQAVRRHLGVGRVVAERGEEEVGQSHGRVRIAARRLRLGCRRTRCTERSSLRRDAPFTGRAHRHAARRPESAAPPVEAVTLSLVVVIVLAVVFDYINGFHDTANAIATSVATRALEPAARGPHGRGVQLHRGVRRHRRGQDHRRRAGRTSRRRPRRSSRPRSSGPSPGTSSPGTSRSRARARRRSSAACSGRPSSPPGVGRPRTSRASSTRSSSRWSPRRSSASSRRSC